MEGVFEDEYGEFPAGSYVRNPPTSRHTPGSAPGCILFVKLWQFDPADRRHVAINTASSAYRAAADRPVVQLLPLFCDSREDVRLERWAPGAAITLTVSGGADVLVLDGAFDEVASTSRRSPGCVCQPAACCRQKPVRRAAECGSKRDTFFTSRVSSGLDTLARRIAQGRFSSRCSSGTARGGNNDS